MKRLFGSTLALTALFTLLPSCEQPKANCTAGVGGFAVKYTLKAGSKTGEGSCDALKGEIVGFAKYNPAKEDDMTRQDFTKAFLAIRPSTLGELAVDAEGVNISDDNRVLDSIGDFDSLTPDDKDVCYVPKISPAAQKLPAFTPNSPGKCVSDGTELAIRVDPVPATDIKYEWSNIRLYVTTAYPGTQMVGDLTYTENGCTASYIVDGLWPAVSCRVVTVEKDEKGKTKCDKDGNPLSTSKVDPALCDPVADPAAGRATGSGINPDLKDRVRCDEVLGLCILDKRPPSLQ